MVGVTEDAGNDVFLVQEGVGPGKVIVFNRHALADGKAVAGDELFFHGALARGRGKAAFGQLGQRDLVRQRDDRDALFHVFELQQGADLVKALDGFHPRQGAENVQVLLIHQQGRGDLEVPEAVAVEVIRAPFFQGRSRIGDAEERRNSDHGNHHDRDERNQLFTDVPACV